MIVRMKQISLKFVPSACTLEEHVRSSPECPAPAEDASRADSADGIAAMKEGGQCTNMVERGGYPMTSKQSQCSVVFKVRVSSQLVPQCFFI